jgi:1-acyl-sn-glycerol-3-phosphate acyltransferase
MIRGLLIGAFFFTMTPLLISLQWLLDKLKLPGWGVIAVGYYRALCWLLRIHIRVVGEPVRDRAVLFVSNHVSLADILVIGSIAPVAFVAKREVAGWPLVGVTARIQRTVRGAVDAVVSYGDPVTADGAANRKAMTKSLEDAVRALNRAMLRGPPRPAPATTS